MIVLGLSLPHNVTCLLKAWGATHLAKGSTGLTDKTLKQTTEKINLALKTIEAFGTESD